MSIADLFESGEKKQQKGHFRNLVLIAKSDGIVSLEESDLLKKIAHQIDLSDNEINEIIANPENFEVNPPVSKTDRYRRLVYLIQMMDADKIFEKEELNNLKRYGIALGFNEDQVVKAVDVVINGFKEGKTVDEIAEAF